MIRYLFLKTHLRLWRLLHSFLYHKYPRSQYLYYRHLVEWTGHMNNHLHHIRLCIYTHLKRFWLFYFNIVVLLKNTPKLNDKNYKVKKRIKPLLHNPFPLHSFGHANFLISSIIGRNWEVLFSDSVVFCFISFIQLNRRFSRASIAQIVSFVS